MTFENVSILRYPTPLTSWTQIRDLALNGELVTRILDIMVNYPGFPPQELNDEQHFSEYRMRWSQRLEKRTDDSALKSRLLESLVDAHRTPVSVLPDRDLINLFDSFEEGDLTPVQLLEELQSLLRCSE